jgi:transposase
LVGQRGDTHGGDGISRVYWVPVYEVLESRGLEVIVVNAREARAVPGRKSDVNDAQWLQRLLACGQLRASIWPGREIAALRVFAHSRAPSGLCRRARPAHAKSTHMNLQLHHVIADVTGATGMKIIRAIVGGQRDPQVLAALRDTRCKASLETVRAALVGNYQPEHLFALKQALELYDFYQRCVAECDTEIEHAVATLNANKEKPQATMPKAHHRTKQPNEINFGKRVALPPRIFRIMSAH